MAKKAAHAKAPDFATAKLPESKVLPTLFFFCGSFRRQFSEFFCGKPGGFLQKNATSRRKRRTPKHTSQQLQSSKRARCVPRLCRLFRCQFSCYPGNLGLCLRTFATSRRKQRMPKHPASRLQSSQRARRSPFEAHRGLFLHVARLGFNLIHYTHM